MKNLIAEAPGYWMNETSGVLRPAVEAYLENRPLTLTEIAAIRAYLRQWIFAPVWRGTEIDGLRDAIDSLTNQAQIKIWIDRAIEIGADPL